MKTGKQQRGISRLTGKSPGSAMQVLATGICILCMTAVMMTFLCSVELIQKKGEISQIARKYILRMETMGHLTLGDETRLVAELQAIGLEAVNLDGTTVSEVGYGEPIALHIQGKIRGKELLTKEGIFAMSFREKEYELMEYRVSTAKN